jgi:hypothetical protein
MMSRLTWATLILAAPAALACCDRRRFVGPIAEHFEAVEADWRAHLIPPARP